MRKSFVALLLLLGAAASMANLALAQSVDDLKGDIGNKMVTARAAQDRISNAARQSPARINHPPGADSIWIGHSFQTRVNGFPNTYSWGPNHIGRGDNHPTALSDVSGNSGLWDWDHFASGYSDSLQGWWPMRRVYSITGGLTLNDDQRPWWAIDHGNQGNYVINNAQGRTRGVLSYWHVDGGTDYTNVPADPNPDLISGAAGVQHLLKGTNALAMTWAPLAGAGSAWCGLRAHGDVTYADPLTNNPYNAMVIEFNGETGGGTTSGVGTNKKFPGYPSQMDQLLYADVQIASGATLDLSFLYQTAMSLGATSTAATRTGWFQFDPSVVGPVAVAGPNLGAPNYISNTGIAAPNTQPADSFMVYIGVPVDINSTSLASGAPAGPVYDLKRRWLSEVIALDKPIKQLLHVAGNTNTSFAVTGESMAAFYAAQSGTNRYVRVVFRSKTNRGFDDLSASTAGAFWSGGKGAVMIDDVAIAGTGVSGGTVGTSGFNSATDIDNSVSTDDLVLNGKWRATGKPPAVFFHTHPLSGGDIGGGNIYTALIYQDICGSPSAPARFCNMRGVVISSGDHEQSEAAGDQVSGTPERERMDGIMSPTVLLANDGIPGNYNDVGVDVDGADAQDDYYVWYDIYTGVYNLFFTGNAWTFGFQSYPGRQADGVLCWGEVRIPGFQIFNPDIQCLQDVEAAAGNGLIRSVTAAPESIRIYMGKNQQCFRFGVTGTSCSSVAGSYFDNISLLLSDASAGGGGASVSIGVDIWRWINDSFPVNDGTSLTPGVAVAPGSAGFDTAGAYIQTGINIAQSPGDRLRFTIPGDSLIVIGDVVESVTGLGRVDMVFRIKPGVGNYHTVGDPNSGLRPRPTDPTNIVVAGDGSFWGQYLANPGAPNGPLSTDAGVGEMGNLLAQGRHGNPAVLGAGGGNNWWNRNVWNSARMDTADVNIHPIPAAVNPGVFDVDATFAGTVQWMGTYHEEDPKYTALGITHNKCFLVAPAGAVNSTNIVCNGTLPAAYAAGTPTTTIEGSKIIPDGLLTPGAHVEYFLRAQDDDGLGPSGLARADSRFVMAPETTFVNPQNNEGSSDGHRWQQFGVLPDRWKNNTFTDTPPGAGMACMLYVDLNDRRGNERAWVSVSDSIGATAASRRGAHNGWRANGGFPNAYTTATGDAIDISGDPSIAVYTHGGQPGSTWDMYGVKASESLTTSAGSLGGRSGQQCTGLALGKDSKLGPTPDMLEYYYPVLMILTGDLNSGIFGKFINRGADDIRLLRAYLTDTPGTSQWSNTKRAILIQGDGFIQSEYATGTAGGDTDHLQLLTDYLGVTARLDPAIGGTPQYSYQPLSGNTNQYADVTTQPLGPIPGEVYSVGNACLWGNDVLALGAPVLNPVASALFQNFGTKGPYIASVYTPIQSGKFYESYVDAWDIEHLYSHYDGSSLGRIGYFWKVFNQISATTGLCQVQGTPMITLDVPPGVGGQQFVDFVSLRNNPMLTGRANVHFGLAKADRVTARVYDVSGRLVRTLVDRNFPAGEHDLYWDGTDDGGRQMERGVYFTQVRYAKTRFTDAKKLTVLK